MKVLIATGIYGELGDIGGPAMYVFYLFNNFSKRGFKTRVITYAGNKPSPEQRKSYLTTISRRLPTPLRHIVYMIKVLWWGRRFDCICVQDPVSVGLPVMIAARFLHKPYILKIVGDYAWEQGQNKYDIRDTLDEFLNKKYSWKIELLRWIEKTVAKRAKRIITPSNYLKSVVMRWGIPEGKIKVVYNAVDTPSILPLQKGEEKGGGQFHGPNHGTAPRQTIISAGRLVPWKGFDTLIEVTAELVKERPNLELVIYGDGPLREDLRLKIKDLRLEDNVKLVGRVSHDELLRILQEQATIFLLNSSYEGMSHQILEAQALGVPVAVSRVGGNPEIVEDGETGLLFEYNNKEQIKQAILKLLNDKDFVVRITNQAREQIKEKHDFNKMIDDTINILQSILRPSA